MKKNNFEDIPRLENWTPEIIKKYDLYWGCSPVEKRFRDLIVQHIKDKISYKSDFLEIGCGTGQIYNILNINNCLKYYIGGDITKEMLIFFEKKYPKIDLRLLDIFNINLPDNFIENVLCVQVFQHLAKIDNPIKNLIKVCIKRVFIFCPLTTKKKSLIQIVDRDGVKFYENCYSINYIEKICNKYKISKLEIKKTDSKNSNNPGYFIYIEK